MYWSELFSSKNCVTLSNFFNSLISLTFGVRVPCRISIHICCALESDYKSKPNLWNIYTFMKSHLNDKLMLRTNFTFLVHFFIFFIVIVCLKYIPNTGFDDAFKRCAIKKKLNLVWSIIHWLFQKYFGFAVVCRCILLYRTIFTWYLKLFIWSGTICSQIWLNCWSRCRQIFEFIYRTLFTEDFRLALSTDHIKIWNLVLNLYV